MTKGDKIRVKRGPLSGLVAELVRHDVLNRAWSAMVNGSKVMVYEFELAETLERKRKHIERKGRKHGKEGV